jgi:hypothetical protein
MSHMGDPAQFAAAITPSDSVNFATPTRAIYVGSAAGNIVAIINDTAITFKLVPIGVLPIQATRVNSTGTTSTDLVALW